MNEPEPIQSEFLIQENIRHGFHTRLGGVSKGIYQGLNVGLGSDDNREDVLENRRRVANYQGVTADHLMTVYQVHSPDIITINNPFEDARRPKADGMVSATPGMALGVMSADCGPVLFADAKNQVVGACHSGWKGAIGGVLENTISAMQRLGAEPKNINAVLGPTISVEHYEVGPEFVDRLMALENSNENFLAPSTNSDHAMFDLPGYIVTRLENAGVNATWTGHCTYADEKRFFSYRRKTHRNEPDYGRQISVISLKNN